MFKKITSFLLVTCCAITLAACDMVDPQATMNVPSLVSQDSDDRSEEVLAKVKDYLPAKAELVKITSSTGTEKAYFKTDLTGDGVSELLLSFIDKDNNIGIVVLQKDGQDYKKLYEETFKDEDNKLKFDKLVDIKPAALIDSDTKQVVISYNFYGADHNSLSVHVLGYDSDQKAVKNYLSLMNMPKAGVDVKDDRILVEAMGITKAYKWNDNKFAGVQVFSNPELKADDVAVHYAMSEEGPMMIDTDEVILKVGQRMILIRDDKLECGERIMTSAEVPGDYDMLELNGDRIYSAIKTGTLTMTIVPNGGYDWDNAKDIKITVEE